MPKRKRLSETCGKCYNFTDTLYETRCKEKPETLIGKPIGMYHCPECATMLLAGAYHPKVCKECLEQWKQNL